MRTACEEEIEPPVGVEAGGVLKIADEPFVFGEEMEETRGVRNGLGLKIEGFAHAANPSDAAAAGDGHSAPQRLSDKHRPPATDAHVSRIMPCDHKQLVAG